MLRLPLEGSLSGIKICDGVVQSTLILESIIVLICYNHKGTEQKSRPDSFTSLSMQMDYIRKDI
jgi:hypothetical protein